VNRFFADFIMTKLQRRCPPGALLTELTAVLDDDAEPFVVKLWRMLIYSTTVAAEEATTAGAK
jgi:hypothetical protein